MGSDHCPIGLKLRLPPASACGTDAVVPEEEKKEDEREASEIGKRLSQISIRAELERDDARGSKRLSKSVPPARSMNDQPEVSA